MEVCKASQNMRCGCSSKVKLEEEAEAEEALIMQNQSNNICSSNKQNSIFSLTLDEFQYKVSTGKSACFGSMNMDEFINSVWNNNAEGGGHGINQAAAAAAAASSNSNQNQPITNPPDDDLDHQNRDQGATCTEAAAATLIPQSSFTCCIPTPLCNKTVEEVWSEINKLNQSSMQQQQQNPNAAINNDHQLLAAQPQQSLTFGEMTLEDFLIKAGVINQEASSLLISSSQRRRRLMLAEEVQNHYHCGTGTTTTTTTTTTTYPSESACCLDIVSNINNIVETAAAGGNVIGGFELSINDHSNSTTGNGNNNLLHNGASMFTQSGRFLGESSTNINGKYCARASDVQAERNIAGRRRSSGPLEVAVERRQRRMIKNRESAARSRARKQAYTAELEIELNQLRDENAGLKLILAEAEMKRRQEVIMKGKQSTKAQRVAEKLRRIRRTSSLAW